MNTSPILVAFEFLWAELGPDLGGLVSACREHPAEQQTSWPVVTWQEQTSSDKTGIGDIRHLTHVDVLVRAVGKNATTVDLADAAQEIDKRVHGATCVPTPSGEMLAATRLQPFILVEESDGTQYRHLGGIYRFTVA